MQDVALQQEQDALGDMILAAMIQSDPTLDAKLERLRAIMVEAHAANGDEAKLTALATEAQSIQPHIERARAQALATPAVDTKVIAFRKNLAERMAQIAPESRPLVQRFEELERMVKASARQPATPTGARGR